MSLISSQIDEVMSAAEFIPVNLTSFSDNGTPGLEPMELMRTTTGSSTAAVNYVIRKG